MVEEENRLTAARECREKIIADTVDDAIAGDVDAIEFFKQQPLDDLEKLHCELPGFEYPTQLAWLRNYITERRAEGSG